MLSPIPITPELAHKIEAILAHHQNMLFLPANAILDAAQHGHFFAFSHPLHPLVFYSIREHCEYWELGSLYGPTLCGTLMQDFEEKRKAQNIPFGMAITAIEKVMNSIASHVSPCDFDFPHVISEERKYTHDGQRKFCVVWQ